MPSKKLMAVWGALDFFLLAAGGGSIAFSILLKAPDAVRNLVLSDMTLMLGMVMGISYVLTFVVSIGAVIQQNHVTIGLAILNWLLILDTAVTVFYGSSLWFMTLREESNFSDVWATTTPEKRIAVQENLRCCGFMNNTMIEPVGFCSVPNSNAVQDNGCYMKFIPLADTILMDIFTIVYGFAGILVCFFIATMCVIKKRQEQERFRRIDAKRGGRGFV